MFRRYQHVFVVLWIIHAEEVALQINGHRKLNLQFDNVTFMDIQARVAMKSMHFELDEDDDGNVSVSEGKEFFANRKDLLENPLGKSNLPGFATDKDGRITEQEFWDTWRQSSVHNWTNTEMLTWLKYEVELPQYISNFHALNISGAALPILAYNGSIVSPLVDGSSKNKLKLMLKAREIVLFGPAKQNFLKDALLTISLVLALGGIFFAVHVQRNANHTIERIEEKMKALQKSMETMEAEGEMDKIWERDISRQDDEHSRGSNSAESEDSMTSISLSDEAMASNKLAEVMRELDATKEALRNAEKQMERKTAELPQGLLECLHTTYQVESKLFEMKKKKVYKDVEQTKLQFQKIERNKSTLLGILQVVHSRQMDSFDLQVQETRDEFRELQTIMKERKKRWSTIELLCKIRLKSSSRISAAPSRAKLTPEEEILSSLESMSQASSSTVSASNAEKTTQKHKTKKRLSITSGLLDDEERDTVSLQSFNLHAKKSPVASKKHGSFPSHVSSPTLSQMNGYDKNEKPDKKHILHSESAVLLPANLTIPEDGNQTFPKRSSPLNKRRTKLADSALVNCGTTSDSPPVSPAGSAQNITKSTSHHKVKVSTLPKNATATSSGLNAAKRSPSIQSLPVRQKKDSSDGPESPTPVLDTKTPKTNGDVKSHALAQIETSPTPSDDQARKSNFFKRKFFKKKTKDKN